MNIKDSGKRQEFNTGSVRDTRENKGRFDLLPPHTLTEYAIHMEQGCNKYGERNWEKGQPLSRYVDSAMRHITKSMYGQADEPHIRAALWNIGCIIETIARIKDGTLPKELDDMGFIDRGY